MSEIKEEQHPAPEGHVLNQLAAACGGEATLHELKDEAGNVVHSFGTMSFPLRKNHWI
jgi:hypothetical protein